MLFNDRYGMQRIYCHESKDAFYFAAEAKAILAVRPELRRMDARGLGRIRRLRRGAGKPDAVSRASRFCRLLRLGSFATARLRTENLFSSTRVGRAGNTRLRILLSGTPASFHTEPAAVFRRPGADRHVLNGWVGHPDDHGLAEMPARISSLLYLRRNVPRLSGCRLEPAGSQRVRADLTR